jgi:hypothetical protein
VYELVKQVQKNEHHRNKPYPEPEMLIGLADNIAQNPIIDIIKLRTEIFHNTLPGCKRMFFGLYYPIDFG